MFDKVSFLSICLLFTTLFFSGCANDDLPDEQEKQDIQGECPIGQNVFVAGFENNHGKEPIARRWKICIIRKGSDGKYQAEHG